MKNYIKGICFGLLIVLFPVIAGTIISIKNITDTSSIYLIQGLLFAIASIIGVFIYRLLFKELNLNKIINVKPLNYKKLMYLVPFILVEILQLIQGINKENTKYILPILLLVIFVGIAEEIYFRGIILRIFNEVSKKRAVYGSAILFSILHLLNLLGGQSPVYTGIQLIFALVWGLVTAEFVFARSSIIPLIIWHSLHDLIGLMSGKGIDAKAIVIVFIQTLILLIYFIYLKRINNKNADLN